MRWDCIIICACCAVAAAGAQPKKKSSLPWLPTSMALPETFQHQVLLLRCMSSLHIARMRCMHP